VPIEIKIETSVISAKALEPIWMREEARPDIAYRSSGSKRGLGISIIVF
jgi:hypothetical protein